MEKTILDIKGVAKLLGVSSYTIYRLVKGKKIPVVKVGKEYRFHAPTIIQWIASGSNVHCLEQILKSKDIRFIKS